MIYTKKNIEPSILVVRVSLLLLFTFLFANNITAQFSRLIINEFSQGSGGTKEYIELLVVGRKTCTDSTADLRGWIIDDSNGWFGTGGIQGGHLRLSINATWQKIPYGSIIFIYNDQDKNLQITLADDPTDNFPKDNVYVVPANSIYADENNNVPLGFGMGVTSYAGAVYTNTGNWNRISLGNGGDAVIIVDPLFPTIAHFSIAYGTVNSGVPSIYKNAVGANTNCYLTDSSYTNSASYATGSAGINETPGAPNGGLNTAWILSMRTRPVPPVVSVNSQTICSGNFATVIATPNPSAIYNYAWTVPAGVNDPGNVSSFTTNVAGNYIVTVTNSLNCTATNSAMVIVNPLPSAPSANAQTFCAANNPTVNDLVATGNNLQWYNSATGGLPLISSTSLISGIYYVSQTAGNCESPRTAVSAVIASVTPMRYSTVNATSNLPQQLQVRTFTPSAQYTWTPTFGLNSYSVDNPIFNYDKTTEYFIRISTPAGCNVVDTLLVKVFPATAQPSDVFVPNAFSPNGDGLNDKLIPVLINIKELKYFKIFNRWGQLVFETKTAGEGWDGTFKGITFDTVIFIWTIDAAGTDGVIHNKRGTVILIR